MNELDEAQDLTLQMVSDYLTAAGWSRIVTGTGGPTGSPGVTPGNQVLAAAASSSARTGGPARSTPLPLQHRRPS